MSSGDFENLVCFAGPAVNKKITNFRNAISVMERLAVTMRLLAPWDSYHSMCTCLKLQRSLIDNTISVCETLINTLEAYVKLCILH
jgi:hypothetical protein